MVNWGKLIFGGVDSSEYGIYITGEAVYNAPERDVEFIEVPGRNGSIAMDNGRYRNITVTYPAGTFGKTPEQFREALSDFRNAILSQKGYQKLEDTYHPEEYRMAVYASGLEVSAVNYGRAGEFELAFECKPQRWLSDGALPIPVDSGDILENPCVFDSQPLLEIEGYGTVSFNGYNVVLNNADVGNIDILPREADHDTEGFSRTYQYDRSLLNEDDVITVGATQFVFYMATSATTPETLFKQVTVTESSGGTITPTTVDYPSYSDSHRGNGLDLTVKTPAFTFGALSDTDTPIDKTVTYVVNGKTGNNVIMTYTATLHIICGYDYITFSLECVYDPAYNQNYLEFIAQKTTAESTLNVLGHPSYIDCELGEAYNADNDGYISLNKYVALGSDLPTLSPGENKIIFSNTITDLKITPRWWRV